MIGRALCRAFVVFVEARKACCIMVVGLRGELASAVCGGSPHLAVRRCSLLYSSVTAHFARQELDSRIIMPVIPEHPADISEHRWDKVTAYIMAQAPYGFDIEVRSSGRRNAH